MANNILERGRGYLAKITVSEVQGDTSLKSKKNKKLYIKLLHDMADSNVCLVAYCITDLAAHFIVKGEDRSVVERYVERVDVAYGNQYDSGRAFHGYPFRNDYDVQVLHSEDLIDAIAYIHSLGGVPAAYEFNSYEELYEGRTGATAVIIAENGGALSRQEFLNQIGRGSRKGYGAVRGGDEKVRDVLKDINSRYLSRQNTEEIVVFSIASLIDRCGLSYRKASKRLGFAKNERRDVMISTICEMMIRRGYSYIDAIVRMKLKPADITGDMRLECIVEMNRQYQYSYDHILTVFGERDFYYANLVTIFCDLHRKFNFTFEELCKRFHIQNDIISIRNRCGF